MSAPDDALLQEAAHWFACHCADDFDAGQQRAWQQWLHTSPAHARAWQRVQEVCARLERARGPGALRALTAPGCDRRQLLRGLAWLAGSTLLVRASSGDGGGHYLQTATGEQRRWHLADGSLLVLNTHSSVRLGPDPAQLQLLAGELYLQTAGPGRSALRVATPQGLVTPLGTRLLVRLHAGSAQVQVLQHAARLQPARAPAAARVLEAGRQARFDARHVGPERALDPGAGAWLQRRLSVLDMPLPQWLRELGRYRPGHLGCAPELAQLRVSGVYPLDDTDAALRLLAASHGLRIQRRSGYWVRLLPGSLP